MKCQLIFGLLFVGLAFSAHSADSERVPPDAKDEGEYPFSEVIQVTTGFKVLEFDGDNPAHRELLGRLRNVARSAAAQAKDEGIRKSRANEVGNAMEDFVLAAMTQQNLSADRPKTQSGRTLSVGYPDIELSSNPPCYVELKTYSARTANSTQRTFYYSPSEDPKITHDALHLLLAFQMVQTEELGQAVWRPDHFRITSLAQLKVKLKIEYNQGNRQLYAEPQLLLDEPVD